MSRITAIALSVFLVLPLGGGLPTSGADEEKKPADPAASSQAENKGKLRGTGMLILDPRDDPEKAKEQLRLLLEQIQSHIPERMRRQANRRQLEALAEDLAQTLKQAGASLHHREGTADSGWVLLDFGDVVLHLFGLEARDFYRMDELWSNARTVVRIQ